MAPIETLSVPAGLVLQLYMVSFLYSLCLLILNGIDAVKKQTYAWFEFILVSLDAVSAVFQWARHKYEHKKALDEKAGRTTQEEEAVQHLVKWSACNRSAIADAMISALDLVHNPDRAQDTVLELRLTRSGCQNKETFYLIVNAEAVSFEQLEARGFKNWEIIERERKRRQADLRAISPSSKFIGGHCRQKCIDLTLSMQP